MKTQIINIRNELRKIKGQGVRLHVIGERNKITDELGVLEGVYSDIFTVRIAYEDYVRRYSYSYAEVLTRHVKIYPIAL